jgi:hypothetical protein
MLPLSPNLRASTAFFFSALRQTTLRYADIGIIPVNSYTSTPMYRLCVHQMESLGGDRLPTIAWFYAGVV